MPKLVADFPNIEQSVRFDKIRSTDHQDMSDAFGVEAGQAGLLEELKRLFKSYSVDSRWLTLVTDRAFFTGVCKPTRPNPKKSVRNVCTNPPKHHFLYYSRGRASLATA